MTVNRHFGKLNTDTNAIEYGPVPLTVSIHHHDEWDEPVYDEETGEPTGETVHRDHNWDTVKVRIRPSVQEYLDMGYLPVDDSLSYAEPKEGYRIERTGEWEEYDGIIRPRFTYVEIPAQPIRISKSKVEAFIDEIGKTALFTQWLNSKASYIGGWMRGGDMLEYDPDVHGTDLESLISALEIPQEDVPVLIEKVKV